MITYLCSCKEVPHSFKGTYVRISPAVCYSTTTVHAYNIVCTPLMSLCSREPHSPSVIDQEESAVQSSEDRGTRQEVLQMGAQSHVSAVQCALQQLTMTSGVCHRVLQSALKRFNKC